MWEHTTTILSKLNVQLSELEADGYNIVAILPIDKEKTTNEVIIIYTDTENNTLFLDAILNNNLKSVISKLDQIIALLTPSI